LTVAWSGIARADAGMTSIGRRRRSTAWLWMTIALLVVGCGVGLSAWAVAGLGQWLVVADPLEPAAGVVVLSGGAPYRAIEAAQIFREGWARQVWITRPPVEADEALVAHLGLKIDFGDEGSSRLILQRLGVSPSAIKTLTPGARNTAEELTRVAAELARTRGDRVIIVTSKSHTRRVRATWRAVVGRSREAIVRYAGLDRFEGSRWWERTEDALAVSREVFGLLNVWAGFPIRPDARPVGPRDIESRSQSFGTLSSPLPARGATD
jgi:uncharacterized SAM-binding protein YcdF (DUF218 family)